MGTLRIEQVPKVFKVPYLAVATHELMSNSEGY